MAKMQHNCYLQRLKFLVMILILFVTVVSCEKENIPNPPVVLTTEVKSDLSAITDKVFLETSTPGIIALISVEGEPDFLIKRGSANLVTNEPVHEENAFRIASVTKTFTGTAVLLLAEEGLISLDSAIVSYLPEYNVPSGNAITVRMLGNMTSGLFDYSEDPGLWEQFIESGYTLGNQGLMDATNWNPSWGYTAGAMISKLEDLKKWAVYLAEGALLSDTMKAERFNFGTNDYGFCVESIHYKDEFWVGHPGVIPGYTTQVWYNSTKKTTLIISSNSENNMPAQTLLIEYIFLLGNL